MNLSRRKRKATTKNKKITEWKSSLVKANIKGRNHPHKKLVGRLKD